MSPSIRNTDNWTPLHHAAAKGDEKTIALLLKHKKTGWFAYGDFTPLHLAAWSGHTAAVRQILKLSGHDWGRERAVAPHVIQNIQAALGNKFDQQFEIFFAEKTFTARELAVINDHVDTALAFDRDSTNDIVNALACACMLRDVHMVETIWKNYESWPRFQGYGRYLGNKNLDSQIRWFPAPLLHLAVMSGNGATVAFLLEEGLQAMLQFFTCRVGGRSEHTCEVMRRYPHANWWH